MLGLYNQKVPVNHDGSVAGLDPTPVATPIKITSPYDSAHYETLSPFASSPIVPSFSEPHLGAKKEKSPDNPSTSVLSPSSSTPDFEG